MRLKPHKRPILTPSFSEREHLELREQEIIATRPVIGISKEQVAEPGGTAQLFDSLPRLMRPEQVAAHFDVSIKTIYDWRHRGCLRGMPQNLFLSLNRRLFIRTDVFVDWIASQNPGLRE